MSKNSSKIKKQICLLQELIQEVPQRSLLGPLLFNIDLNDLFFILLNLLMYVCEDFRTFNLCDKDLKSLINRLEH